MSYILLIVGAVLAIVGVIRVKTDFKDNKKNNNMIQFMLTGQASGIGQVISGILCLIIGVIVLIMQ